MGYIAPTSVGVQASRQKNCNKCVQAKRRCDRRTPVCSRCVEKKLTCSYGKTGASGRHGRLDAESTQTPTPYIGVGLTTNSSAPCSPLSSDIAFDLGCLVDMPMVSQPDFINPELDVPGVDGGAAMSSFMNPCDTIDTLPKDQWLIQFDDHIFNERPGTPVGAEDEAAYQKISSWCHRIKPWEMYDTTSLLYDVVKRLKKSVSDMATQNGASFLHRCLYKAHMPHCIMACFSICVMYTNRVPDNMAMVMRAVHTGIQELTSTEEGRTAATPADKLARTQALSLYLTICLFDGDITLRAKGEDGLPLFHSWLGELRKIRDNLGESAGLEDCVRRQQPPEDWEQWMFAESLRRTIVVSYAMMSLYSLLKSKPIEATDPETGGAWLYAHRWTLARSLWEATSSSDFNRRWADTPQFIITNFTLDSFAEHGRAEDVDDLARLFLPMYIGLDGMKEFMSPRDNKTE